MGKGRKVNVGLDLTLLKNRLTLSADYYNDYYYDILQSRGKSIQLLGIAYPAENIGKHVTTDWKHNLAGKTTLVK